MFRDSPVGAGKQLADPGADLRLPTGTWICSAGPVHHHRRLAVESVLSGTPVVEEALAQAVGRDVNGVLTRVFTAEHLAATCLEVGRPKDHDRVIRFVEAGVLDAERFESILQRHHLMDRWGKFEDTYFRS